MFTLRLRSLLFLAAMLIAPPTIATTVLQVDTQTLVTTSEWIVKVEVTAVRSVDLRHEGRAIFTDVDLRIDSVYKGHHVPERYTMRQPGGTGADGITFMVPGMPRFMVGDKAVLFLERSPLGHIPCGLGQGVWRVTEPTKGEPWVQQSIINANLVRRAEDGRLQAAAPKLHTDAQPLASLVESIYGIQSQQSPPTP